MLRVAECLLRGDHGSWMEGAWATSTKKGRAVHFATWSRNRSLSARAGSRRTTSRSHELSIEGEAPSRSPQRRRPRVVTCVRTRGLQKKIRQRPTLPRGFPRSTIGSGGLNFRVRDGNGWDPSDIATGNCVTVHTKGRVSIPARSAFFRAGTTLVECARGLDLGLESSRPTRLAGRAQERLR